MLKILIHILIQKIRVLNPKVQNEVKISLNTYVL